MFPALKQNLYGHKFDDRKVETVVTRRTIIQNKNFYQQGMENLVSRYYKFLSCGGGYVKTERYRSTIKPELLILQLKITYVFEINNPKQVQAKLHFLTDPPTSATHITS